MTVRCLPRTASRRGARLLQRQASSCAYLASDTRCKIGKRTLVLGALHKGSPGPFLCVKHDIDVPVISTNKNLWRPFQTNQKIICILLYAEKTLSSLSREAFFFVSIGLYAIIISFVQNGPACIMLGQQTGWCTLDDAWIDPAQCVYQPCTMSVSTLRAVLSITASLLWRLQGTTITAVLLWWAYCQQRFYN